MKYLSEVFPNETPENSREWFLRHPIFQHIRTISHEGVPKIAGYAYHDDFRPNLDDDQIRTLLDLTHSLYGTYHVIEIMVREPNHPMEPVSKELADTIRKDPFAGFLFELRRREVITDGQLIFRLQEDAFWQTRFLEWETLRMTKLRKEDGVYTETPLTLDDIRHETVEELRNIRPKP